MPRCRRSRGWVQGRKHGRGPSAFFEGTPSCSSVLVPIISRRRCLPEPHRTRPPRTPDARSCKLSERERAGAFPPRSCEGTVHGIAHQVKPEWWVARRSGRRWSSLKKCGWPPAALPSVCRSRRPQGSLVRPATADVRGHCVARGELTTVAGDARRATKSAMSLLPVHCTLAPAEGPRWQHCGAGLEARIHAHGAADEILRSRASGCVGSRSA